MSLSYCVVCEWKDPDDGCAPQIVGPFATQAEAVEWAHEHRSMNRAWNYRPDVMVAPE